MRTNIGKTDIGRKFLISSGLPPLNDVRIFDEHHSSQSSSSPSNISLYLDTTKFEKKLSLSLTSQVTQ